jgi:hypothetical protein
MGFLLFDFLKNVLLRKKIPLNRGMDTENVVHLHNGVTTQLLKTMNFSLFFSPF